MQNIPAYVVKTLQNEFGEVVEDSKVYSPPESIRQQLRAAQSTERAPAEERSAEVGLGSIAEHIAKIIPSHSKIDE